MTRLVMTQRPSILNADKRGVRHVVNLLSADSLACTSVLQGKQLVGLLAAWENQLMSKASQYMFLAKWQSKSINAFVLS
jgi:hypothetical protein